jgi:hypothetical protein
MIPSYHIGHSVQMGYAGYDTSHDTKFHAWRRGRAGAVPSCPATQGQVAGDAFPPVRGTLQIFIIIFPGRCPSVDRPPWSTSLSSSEL